MPYLWLLKSMHHWFESRGERQPYSRHAAAMACAVFIYMNIATITLFAHALFGARWYRIFGNVPLNILSVFSLVGLNSQLIANMQKRDEQSNHSPGRERVSVAPIWAYVGASVVLLFVSTALATTSGWPR